MHRVCLWHWQILNRLSDPATFTPNFLLAEVERLDCHIVVTHQQLASDNLDVDPMYSGKSIVGSNCFRSLLGY